MKIREIVKEEVRRMKELMEAGPSRGFTKAAEAMYDAELQQQQLRKKFVAEKNPKKKDKIKTALILMHKKVQKLQSAFNAVLRDEPVDLEMEVAESLTEIRKGDYVEQYGEIGLVNKLKGQVVYVKFDSNPKSFHPILASSLTKSGKKHKGKDLYTEGKLNEASSIWKSLDAKWKLQDQIMDLEMDMKEITKDLSQLHKDMEQEAEPGGGKIADRYGRDIDKKEKEYKKKKAEFKKLMAKLDKLEQF